MLTYAGKRLGELTGKVLQNVICIVFLFPVWVPSSAAPKVGLTHQRESGLDFFYTESRCQGEKIRWRIGLFAYFQLLNQAGFIRFVSFLPGTKFMQGQFMNCVCAGVKICGDPG